MLKNSIVLAVVVLVLGVCNVQAAQVNSTWVGGVSHDWENSANWNPQLVPDNNASKTYAVTITGSTYVNLSANNSIDSLDTYNTVKLEAEGAVEQPDITLTNNLTNHGLLKMVGPEIFGKVVNLAGATILVYNYHEFNVFGPGGIQNFGTVLLGPAIQMWTEYDVNNSGLIEMYDGICGAEGNIINNAAGIIRGSGMVGFETIQIDNKGLIQGGGGTLSLFALSISNTGTMKNNPGATITARAGLNNQGTIEINSDGAITFDSNFINEPNGIVRMLGGTLAATKITQKAGAMLEGDGKITGNLLLETNANAALTGPTEIYGDVQIDSNAVLDINDGTTLIKGHCTCNNGTIHLKGGWLIPQGGLTNNNCDILWEPGLYTNVADFNLDGKVDFKDFAYFGDTWLWQTQW